MVITTKHQSIPRIVAPIELLSDNMRSLQELVDRNAAHGTLASVALEHVEPKLRLTGT